MFPDLSNDEILLHRYLDGEVSVEEKHAIEERLARDVDFCARLAELVSFNASLELGLAGLVSGNEAQPLVGRRRGPGHSSGEPARSWIGRHPAGAVAAALVVLVGGGAFAWFAAKGSDPTADPYRIVSTLEGRLDTARIRADLDEVLGTPPGEPGRRQEIYRSWQAFDPGLLEPLIWVLAPSERDSAARATLYIALPRDRAIQDRAALLAAARAEWAAAEMAPLSQLVTQLCLNPGPDAEDLLSEVLQSRPKVEPSWLGERLPPIQSAFRGSPLICNLVIGALQDPDETVRAWAGLARAAIRQRDGIECARRLLRSTNVEVRRIATSTIARHGVEADIPDLLALIDDPDGCVKEMARGALAAHKIAIPSAQ